MAAPTFTKANISCDPIMGSLPRDRQAATGYTPAMGDCVYIDSNNLVNKADADVLIANARAFGIVTALPNQYGETTGPDGGWCQVTTFGPVYGYSGLTTGQYFWVSKTAGALDDTAPTGGAFQQIVARAIASDTLFVDPGIANPASV